MRETQEEFIKRKKEEFDLDLKSGKTRVFEDIGRQGHNHWLREAWTFKAQSNMPEDKVFCVERFRLIKQSGVVVHKGELNAIEYRIGYWMVGKNGRVVDRWTWGQFCPTVPGTDLAPLLSRALKEGTILGEHFSFA